jgi:hypothetical protein
MDFRDSCSNQSHSDTPSNKSRDTKFLLQMQSIEASDGPFDKISLYSSGDQLGEPTKSFSQLIRDFEKLTKNPIISGFRNMDQQQIIDEYEKLKSNVESSKPEPISVRQVMPNSCQKQIKAYNENVLQLQGFCKDLEKYVHTKEVKGKSIQNIDQYDSIRSGNHNGLRNHEVMINISSEDNNEDSVKDNNIGDYGLKYIIGYIKDKICKPSQQPISDRDEGIELTNRTDQPRVIFKKDIQKLRYQLEETTKKFTNSHSELNCFVERVERSIKNAKFARNTIDEFSGDWQTVVSYAGDIIANSSDGIRKRSERGIIDKDMLIQNVNARIVQAQQSLEDIKKQLANSEINVLESSQTLRRHYANLSEIWSAMQQINRSQSSLRRPMRKLQSSQERFMARISTSMPKPWGPSKELTAQQEMEEQRIRGLVNVRKIVYNMLDMCRYNINEIVSYWCNNFDRINQSASTDTNEIFEQINQTKGYIKKVEGMMERTKPENEKGLSPEFKRHYTMSNLLKITDRLSEKNKQLSDIWTKLQEQSSENLSAHPSEIDTHVEVHTNQRTNHLEGKVFNTDAPSTSNSRAEAGESSDRPSHTTETTHTTLSPEKQSLDGLESRIDPVTIDPNPRSERQISSEAQRDEIPHSEGQISITTLSDAPSTSNSSVESEQSGGQEGNNKSGELTSILKNRTQSLELKKKHQGKQVKGIRFNDQEIGLSQTASESRIDPVTIDPNPRSERQIFNRKQRGEIPHMERVLPNPDQSKKFEQWLEASKTLSKSDFKEKLDKLCKTSPIKERNKFRQQLEKSLGELERSLNELQNNPRLSNFRNDVSCMIHNHRVRFASRLKEIRPQLPVIGASSCINGKSELLTEYIKIIGEKWFDYSAIVNKKRDSTKINHIHNGQARASISKAK